MSDITNIIHGIASSVSFEALELVMKIKSNAIERLVKKRNEKRCQIQELEKQIALIDTKLTSVRLDYFLAHRALKEKRGDE